MNETRWRFLIFLISTLFLNLTTSFKCTIQLFFDEQSFQLSKYTFTAE